jgi:thioredoxin-dependent peroxiredoxin
MNMTTSDALVGKQLPTVSLESTEGETINIPDDLKGKWTLLYFYPKDDTPGCTKQACNYRDNISKFQKLGVQVLGVSGDDLDSHDDFIKKFSLNFPLLADTDHSLSTALGVYGDQTWNEKTYKGLSRDTFLVDPEGKVRQVWRKVKPDATVNETFEAVQNLVKASKDSI